MPAVEIESFSEPSNDPSLILLLLLLLLLLLKSKRRGHKQHKVEQASLQFWSNEVIRHRLPHCSLLPLPLKILMPSMLSQVKDEEKENVKQSVSEWVNEWVSEWNTRTWLTHRVLRLELEKHTLGNSWLGSPRYLSYFISFSLFLSSAPPVFLSTVSSIQVNRMGIATVVTMMHFLSVSFFSLHHSCSLESRCILDPFLDVARVRMLQTSRQEKMDAVYIRARVCLYRLRLIPSCSFSTSFTGPCLNGFV